jgi:2-oxo-4-hydroxy-4-carboxy-5-ureidoimidazoline decarboxylase
MAIARSTLNEINAMDQGAFTALLGDIFEHSPWVAERAWTARPFASVAALHAAMTESVRNASPAEQLALIRAHPELAGREAAAGTLTDSSTGEQKRLGFTALTRAEFERITAVNRSYREKFGFPCIVALKLHVDRTSVMDQMERRVANDPDTERRTALEQIAHIGRGRLSALFLEQ